MRATAPAFAAFLCILASMVPFPTWAEAQDVAIHGDRLIDVLPGVRGAIWRSESGIRGATRLELKDRASGSTRLTISLRVSASKCISPGRDFEHPPNLGNAKLGQLEVGYSQGAGSTLANVRACGPFASAGRSLYLSATSTIFIERDRELLETALDAAFRALSSEPHLLQAREMSRRLPRGERQNLEVELRALLGQHGDQRLMQDRIDTLNRRAKSNPKVSSDEDLAGALFFSLGWRMWLDMPSRVPTQEPDEGDEYKPFENMAQAWSVNVGAVRGNLFGAFSGDLYTGGSVLDGATPGVYQLVAGVGAAGRTWSKGGVSTITSYTHERLDKYGHPCKKINFDQDKALVEEELRSAAPCTHVRVTEHKSQIDIPPGWIMGWAGVYGGWRYVTDMLGGNSGDEMRPLNDGGGPVVGGAFFARRMGLALEFSGDIAYYAHGWDDHGRLAYNGRVGFGSILAMMDLRWRLDSAVGKEFMVGIQARTDLFDGVGFWSK